MVFSAIENKSAPKKRLVILQPAYLPWTGFFDLMHKADIFVIFDDVQYTVRDWRSRNRIKTPDGVLWLSVPVQAKRVRNKLIRDVEIDNTKPWQKKHLKNLQGFYKKAPYYDEITDIFLAIYQKKYKFLIDVDIDFIMQVRQYFSLKSEIAFSSDIPSQGSKDEKLLSICRYFNATKYLSGNAAKSYLREKVFESEGITVEWHNYKHPYFQQLWTKEQGFISYLSIIDLLFNHGIESLDILTGQKVITKPDWIQQRHADEFCQSNK